MAGNETIAVLGAGGTMGLAMARNLAGAGFAVRAWNRTREKAEPLEDDGVEVLDASSDAAEGADLVLTMLSDADAVLEAAEEAFGEGGEAVWLQMSTIGEDGTARCAELASQRGLQFVDAPVLGTKEPAEKGELIVLASGPEDLRDRLEPVFDAVGKRTLWVGEAGGGSRLKLATNSWIVTVVEGCAETLALTESLGLDPRLLLQAVEGGALDLPYLQMKGQAMIERNFEPSFKLRLATKDARLAERAAAERGLELPLITTIRERLELAVDDHGDEDVSVTFLSSSPG